VVVSHPLTRTDPDSHPQPPPSPHVITIVPASGTEPYRYGCEESVFVRAGEQHSDHRRSAAHRLRVAGAKGSGVVRPRSAGSGLTLRGDRGPTLKALYSGRLVEPHLFISPRKSHTIQSFTLSAKMKVQSSRGCTFWKAAGSGCWQDVMATAVGTLRPEG
jgi:hypothetical protein